MVATIRIGATRQGPDGYFLTPIRHYVYAGDTGLHIASLRTTVEWRSYSSRDGAHVRGRTGAAQSPSITPWTEVPEGRTGDPRAQRSIIEFLIAAWNRTCDKSGVAPLHRAVRTRSSEAVRSLLENGADLRLMSKSGSTPLHLAVHNTGRSHSGMDEAKDQQREIIDVLLQHGARPTDEDAKGKTVEAAAAGQLDPRAAQPAVVTAAIGEPHHVVGAPNTSRRGKIGPVHRRRRPR